VYEDLVTQLEEAPAAAAAVKGEPGSHPDATSNGVAAAGAAAAAGGAPPPPPADGQPQQQDEEQQQQQRHPKGGPLAALPPDQQALAWIQYMRFAQRSESVMAMRKVGGWVRGVHGWVGAWGWGWAGGVGVGVGVCG
jgi:hypothetical protein